LLSMMVVKRFEISLWLDSREKKNCEATV